MGTDHVASDTSNVELNEDSEFLAMRQVYASLVPLSPESRARVVEYVSSRLGFSWSRGTTEADLHRPTTREPAASREPQRVERQLEGSTEEDEASEDVGGVSPPGLKWMRRSNLSLAQLEPIFSVNLDEIDLIASEIPGRGKASRMANVLRLKCLAQYLATGAAKVTHDDFNEACVHYHAQDAGHFAENMRALNAEVTGSKETGYQLTPKGMTVATALVKDMIAKA
jgi:hypothetical protein